MATGALIYRKASNRDLFAAFICATCVFAGALCFGNTARNLTISDPGDSESSPYTENTEIDAQLESDPEVIPVPATTDDLFPEETTVSPVQTVTKKQSRPITRPSIASRAGAGISGRGVTLAVYAPRPDYPYEARRQGAVGTGLVSLTIDSGTGLVTSARMIRTTGKAILDSSALKALSRWRFGIGTARVLEIPITFTLTGPSVLMETRSLALEMSALPGGTCRQAVHDWAQSDGDGGADDGGQAILMIAE